MNAPTAPSIFNDVLGPVMRGPSSSHCAGALRIGRLVYDFMAGEIDSIHIQFDPNGSLATTHASQGSDMGLFGGLLGWEATDERLPESALWLEKAGIDVKIKIAPLAEKHPNTYHLTVGSGRGQHEIVALSTGGGMVEIVAIDGVALSVAGDYHETLIGLSGAGDALIGFLKNQTTADAVINHQNRWVEVKSQASLPDALIEQLGARPNVETIHRLRPVLPVLSSADMRVPFLTAEAMLAASHQTPLYRLALHYESARSGLLPAEVEGRMLDLVAIWELSVAQGLEGTDYGDRILGQQSDGFQAAMSQKRLLDGGVLNMMTLYVTALMEMKSSMGVIIAAPTAGSCGGLPGAVLGAAEVMGLQSTPKARALLAGGMIGVFIAHHATFAAEVGGCQAECGAGSGMAAAALVDLAGGTAQQAVAAASMALQNSFGMTCDPVANRVEVPCLGKNVMAAANALSCANMALAGFDAVVPLDEVITAMHGVGQSLPMALRCTALGGLSVTETSKAIEKRLNPIQI